MLTLAEDIILLLLDDDTGFVIKKNIDNIIKRKTRASLDKPLFFKCLHPR